MVEGGAPGERLYECVVIDSDGNVLYETEDKLRRRRRRKVSRQLAPDRLKAAFATVRACAGLEYKGFAGQILPGTLVGFLRVQSGKKEETVYFPLEEAETVRRGIAAPSRLRLHSGKKLAVPRGAVPRRFITAADSINKVAKLLDKAESRSKGR